MARYLTRLYDTFAVTAFQNTKDFDARSEDYATQVSAKVWQTVRQLREGRKVFRMQVNREAREEKKRRKLKPPPSAE